MNARFLVMGAIEQQSGFQHCLLNQVRRLGIERHIAFIGRVERMEEAYAGLDLQVVPTRYTEALGNVNLEAMAAARPVIGTRVGGIPEAISDGETGFLVDSQQAAQIAERIIQLAHDPALRQRMGLAAQARAQRLFDIRRNAQAVERVLMALSVPKTPNIQFTLRLLWARAFVFVWRFSTLPLALRLFAEAPHPYLLARRFYGRQLVLDVSRSNAHKILYLTGKRMLKEQILFNGLISEGQTVVDVGANIGYYMLMFMHFIGPQGRLICLEPEPSNFAELKCNVEANRLSNVELIQAAAGDREGHVRLIPGINGIVDIGNKSELSVRLVTLNSLLPTKVDFVKIDVEGFEASVLRGAQELLTNQRPTLFIEIHPHLLPKNESVRDILRYLCGLYRVVDCYTKTSRYGLTRLFGGYFSRLAISKMHIAATDMEPLNKPFWVICKR